LLARYFLAAGSDEAIKRASEVARSLSGSIAFPPSDFCVAEWATLSELGVLNLIPQDDALHLLKGPLNKLNDQMQALKYGVQGLVILKRRESFMQTIRQQRGRYDTN
jgi:hypothetical protein